MRFSAIINGVICSVLFTLAGATVTRAEEAGSITEAITGGTAHLNFRLRYENVDQDGISNDAEAFTLKTRINYKTGSYNNFHLFVEVDNVSHIGNDKFNDVRNGNGTYPVVADPNGTDVNQAYVAYGGPDTTVKFGRQRILLDTQRYVGGVGWRQNEQTYDALSIVNKSLANTTLTYAYINKVNRIFGPDEPAVTGQAKEWDSESHLLNAGIGVGDLGKVTLYGYFMDFDDKSATPGDERNNSNQTWEFDLRANGPWVTPRYSTPLNTQIRKITATALKTIPQTTLTPNWGLPSPLPLSRWVSRISKAMATVRSSLLLWQPCINFRAGPTNSWHTRIRVSKTPTWPLPVSRSVPRPHWPITSSMPTRVVLSMALSGIFPSPRNWTIISACCTEIRLLRCRWSSYRYREALADADG